VAFGLASSTATALGTHQRTSRSSINYLKNMPDPRNSTSARSSRRGNPRTLRSPAEHGQDLRSQTLVGTAAVNSKCTTLPTSTPLVRPLAVKIIPPGPRQWHAWSGSRTGTTATQVLLPISQRRLRTPDEGLPGNEATRDRMSRVQPADNPRVVAHTYQHHLPQPYNHGPAQHPPNHTY
jgi:hypothetical protein